MALRGIGAVDALQGNYGQAMEDYEKSLTLAHEADDKSLIASILSNIGIVHAKQGKYAEASKYYENSLRLAEAVGDKPLIASLLSNIAMIHLAQGDNARALEYLQKSLTLAEDAGDKERTAASLSNLGVVYRGQADYARALDCYQRSVTIAQELGKKEQVALGLNNMGTVYQLRGNYARALDYYEKSLAMCEELGAKERVIVALYNIGELHRLQGNYAQALEHYQRALKMSEALDDQGKTATLLNSLGTLYQEQGKYTQALEFCVRGLTLAETSGDKSEISFALDAVGQVHRWQGNYSRALEYFQKSLTMREALGDRQGIAETLQNIGEVYAAQRDYTRALESAERAAGVAREIGLREVVWEASTTAGKAYRGLGEPTSAYKTFEEAIAAIETLRTQVAGGEEEQQRFFENKLVPYRQVIELLVTENRPGDALSYAERAKGRVLLDVLRSGRINVTKAMTTTEQGQEQAFRDQLVSLNGQISRENEVPKPDAKRLADLKTRLDKARLDYDAFQTSLYAAHPELKSQRGEVQPVTVDEAADLLPGVESALLEYEVTEDKTYLFVLTRSAGSGTDLRAYPLGIQPKDLAKKTEQFRQQLAQRDLSFRASAAALYETLLAPAQQQLRGKTALVIVPDGALWELPFQALQSSSNRYLLENCAIAYAPSLTVLREMVRLRRRNAQTASKTEALLAMGNPALGKLTTDRVQMAYRDEKLAPLPDAEREVRGLGQVYGAGHSKVYVGGEASEERFKAEAGVYQVIHLATHGFFNNTSPMYSHVVLSQAGNNDKEDGLLEAWEIMQMDLKADLAVLSACETGRGRAGAGEGLIGLTWALFVAGVPTTVVSQWKVESASTTELMLEFHRRLKSGIKGSSASLSSAQALRQAALKLLHSDQYAHPFYWAPFVVVGNGF